MEIKDAFKPIAATLVYDGGETVTKVDGVIHPGGGFEETDCQTEPKPINRETK